LDRSDRTVFLSWDVIFEEGLTYLAQPAMPSISIGDNDPLKKTSTAVVNENLPNLDNELIV